MEDTEVSARTVSDLRSDSAEELSYSVFVLKVAEDNSARVGRVILRLGDERLNLHLKSLSLGNGGVDSLVEDQG